MIKESVRQVLGDLLRDQVPGIGLLCSKKVLTEIITKLDQQSTRKVQKNLAKKALDKSNTGGGTGVGEVFSPPRMATAAARLGVPSHFSMDITTCDDEGRPWDLSNPEVQARATERLDTQKPYMLIASPPCTLFSILQALNFYKQDADEVRARMKEAMSHLSFAVFLCLRQARAGRKFVFEHPNRATSLGTSLVHLLYSIGGGVPTVIDMCSFGLRSADAD